MAGDLSSVLEPGEQTLLASGLGRTEGPLWHPEGYLTFVDLGGRRNSGSVKKMLPSERHTTSLGLLNRLPW